MNTEQIEHFVMRYLESMECQVMEKTPVYVTVKLSEQADRALTNRPYYWGFVDRTGAEPETMRFTFVFDPAKLPPERGPVSYVTAPAGQPPASGGTNQPDGGQDSIMGRYFGVAPAFTGGGGGIGRIPRENVHYGSPRLESMMRAAAEQGRFIALFDQGYAEHRPISRGPKRSLAYEPWLMLNLKVEFACDLKREEIHSLGISLYNGAIQEGFMEQLQQRDMSPKLPNHVHTVPSRFTVDQGILLIEDHLNELLKDIDLTWAIEASERLEEELDLLDAYYIPLLKQEQEQEAARAAQEAAPAVVPTIINKPPSSLILPEDKEQQKESEQEQTESSVPMSIQEQYNMRRKELEWQFEPRIEIHLINAALVHLPHEQS